MTDTLRVFGPIAAMVGAVVLALVLASIISAVVRSSARRSTLTLDLIRRVRRPLQAVLVIVAAWIALRLSTGPAGWRRTVEHVLLILLIVGGAWLIGALAFVAEDAALTRYRMDVPDNRRARRVRTQITVIRRLTVVLLAVCAMASVLMTFPSARAAGASLFASAGVISIVAGLAAQSSLANVFAGLQLAFTDAIRVDDVVIVEGEWGRIEEITMTYVVVHVWDDRRLIVPSTFFTTTPFQNWTRRDANLLGTVEIDVDWSVPVAAMRDELTRLLAASDLWDHRVGVLQVTVATGGFVQVRALASAVDAPTLFDLRCYVREGLVDWLQREQPQALPRTRIEGSRDITARVASLAGQPVRPGGAPRPDRDLAPAGEAPPGPDLPAGPAESSAAEAPAAAPPARSSAWRGARVDDTVQMASHTDARLFTGSIDAVERAQAFTGPGREVVAEREQTAERALGEPDESEDDDRPAR